MIFGVAWGLSAEATGKTGWLALQLPAKKAYIYFIYRLIVVFFGYMAFYDSFWASSYLSGADSWTMFVAEFLAFICSASGIQSTSGIVYDRTGSLPVVMLMHAFLSAALWYSNRQRPGKSPYMEFSTGIILWIIVATVVAINLGIPHKNLIFKHFRFLNPSYDREILPVKRQ